MLKKVVIALDGSQNSERAFGFACDLGAKFKSEIHLVHVVTEREVPDDIKRMAEIERLIPSQLKTEEEESGTSRRFGSVLKTVDKGGDTYRILEKLGENLLASSKEDAEGKGVGSVTTALLRGDPATELIKYLKSNGVDAVISGSRGLGKLRGLLVGSVSSKLAQYAPCSSIVVK